MTAAEYPTEWSFAGVLVRLYAALCETKPAPPDVFAFLGEYPRATVRQRTDVLLFDQFYRWSCGLGRPVESYFQRCRDVGSDANLRLELVVEEFSYRQDRGEQPQVADFQKRFPDLADAIGSILPERRGRQRYTSQAELIRHIAGRSTMSSTRFGSSTIMFREETPFGDTPGPAIERRPSSASLLADCEPFSSLPPGVVDLIESRMSERAYAAGAPLIRQGDRGDGLLVLIDGEVEIATDNDQSGRTVLLRTDHTQVLGEMALLTDEPRSAHVVATRPCRVLVLPVETFHELAGEYPALSVVLTLLIAKRLGRSDRPDVLAGKTFDGYRIRRRLGRGGMAIVYEADEVATGRRVALKMMSHRLVYDDAALEQFQREADIIEAFEHENIARLYGRFAAFHTFFIVMEFCEGETLERVLHRSGAFPEIEFRKVLGQLARALTYAHDAGIIHRDIKPSNVFLTREGRVLLMDFGLARPLIETHPSLVNLMVGTPRYMAPEQIAGSASDRAADYWSLGCVAWEMLCGRPLFPENDMLDILRRHAGWSPPDFRMAAPELSDEAGELLACSLRRDTGERRLDLAALAAWAAPVNAQPLLDHADRSQDGPR